MVAPRKGKHLKLDGWIPIRVFWRHGQARPEVEWCRLGEAGFTDPFFESTVQRLMSHPFHHAFRRRTSIDALEEWRAQRPGLAPTGFIFHMSRCGSTLVSQMLAAVDRNVVLSEAAPIDWVLRAGVPAAQRTAMRSASGAARAIDLIGRTMARITIEDCLARIPNRFELTLAATNRARQITSGSPPMVDADRDKPTVIALREMAAGKFGIEMLTKTAPIIPPQL